MAILRLMSHPGIARLISSFIFEDKAYLVLEYAKKGDLHTYILSNGSIDESTTKFIIGEVLAALQSINEMGFVYGDLKTENILIHDSGHIKLTDFGGCRPLTKVAIGLLQQSYHEVKKIRSGHWKEEEIKQQETKNQNIEAISESEMKAFEDYGLLEDHLEGTVAYLKPGGGAWKTKSRPICRFLVPWLCSVFCLSGKPPLFDLMDKVEAMDKRNLKKTRNRSCGRKLLLLLQIRV